MEKDSMKLLSISNTDKNVFLFPQMSAGSDCPVVAAATHGEGAKTHGVHFIK